MTISRTGKALAFTIVVGTIAAAGSTVASLALPHRSQVLPKVAMKDLVFPEANRESKQDRLNIVVAHAPASETITYQTASAVDPANDVQPQAPVAAAAPAEEIANPVTASVQPVARPKPVMPKPPTAAMVRDNQIATIKERLRLTSAQEAYWPAVESALRGVLVQVYEAKRHGNTTIDVNSAEVQRLKDAAMPLLFQMREDQKREVRNFAQVIGLTDVASMI